MHRNAILSIVAACVVAATAMSCSKSSAARPIKDLGVVELTENAQKRINLVEGKDAFLTATALPDGTLELVFKTESKTAAGVLTRREQKSAVPSGKHIIMSFDGVVLGLTPILKTN